MKKIKSLIKFSSVLILMLSPFLISGCTYTESQSTMNQGPDGYNIDDLNNYGEWVHIDPYGNAWSPFVVSDWMPFENGYWTYADGNWTWISYEPFGWIVYHYGYWYKDSFYGWVWIPADNDWSPARVKWIDYGDYIGWAPMPPPGFVYPSPWEKRENHYWHIVRRKDFTRNDIQNYVVQNLVRNDMGGRNIENNPPSRSRIESSTGSRISEVKIPREDVRVQKREIKKMKLPPEEVRKVQQNTPLISQKVLVPRDRYREQHNQTMQKTRKDNSKR